MKDIAKKYEKKHVIECHNVPDIDMNKQDGGLPHMAVFIHTRYEEAAGQMEIIHIIMHLC